MESNQTTQSFDLERVFTQAVVYYRRAWASYLWIWFLSVVAALCLAIPLVVGVIFIVVGLGIGATGNDEVILATFLGSLPGLALFSLALCAYVALGIFQNGLLIEVTSQLFQGYERNLGTAFQWARRRFWRYLGVGFLVGLGVMFGLILLIIPGFILLTYWNLAQYVVAREDRGIWEAIGRSRQLVSRAFGGTLLGWIVIFVGGLAVIGTLNFGTTTASSGGVMLGSTFVGLLVSLAIQFFWYPFWGALYDELLRLERAAATPTLPPLEPAATVQEPSTSAHTSAASRVSELSKRRPAHRRSSRQSS